MDFENANWRGLYLLVRTVLLYYGTYLITS